MFLTGIRSGIMKIERIVISPIAICSFLNFHFLFMSMDVSKSSISPTAKIASQYRGMGEYKPEE